MTTTRTLYVVTDRGAALFVGDLQTASAMAGGDRRLQPLTEREADLYVQEGCDGLTRLFASVGRVPR